MKTPRHVLAQLIAQRTIDVQDPKLLAQQIAAYLLTERRVGDLESILRDVMQYRADHGVLEAEVVTAHEVDERILTEVRQLLQAAYKEAKTVHVTSHLDSAIVGGLRIDMPNEQLDMSVRSKLATFKRLTSKEGI